MNIIEQRHALGDKWRNLNQTASEFHTVIENGSRYANAHRDARGEVVKEIKAINAEIQKIDQDNRDNPEYHRIFLAP